jgi:hypothetical protein
LEASGRELESIVVGEIQKAYNVLAGILRRDADDAYDAAEKLREGPLAMVKDFEWDSFVTNNNQMVDPRNPVRQVSHVTYPGKDHPAAIEVKSGMLERKSKYLKNYTPGWYAYFQFGMFSVTYECLGTSCLQHIFTNSNPPIESPFSPQSCHFIYQNKNLARTRNPDPHLTSLC